MAAGTIEEIRAACDARNATCLRTIETIMDLHDSRFVEIVHPVRACVPRGTDRAMLTEVVRDGLLAMDSTLQFNAAEAVLVTLSRRFPCLP